MTMSAPHCNRGLCFTTWLDLLVTAAILVMDIELVFDARIASGFTICNTSNTAFARLFEATAICVL